MWNHDDENSNLSMLRIGYSTVIAKTNAAAYDITVILTNWKAYHKTRKQTEISF